MNDGKSLKLFYSDNIEIKKLINDLIRQWPYGFCEQVDKLISNDYRYINIEPYKDLDSTKSVIKAYMHLVCGYAPVCIDGGEVSAWIDSGNIYREIEVKGEGKELAYNFWNAMEKARYIYHKDGYEINGTFMTVIADFDVLKDWKLYVAICRDFADLHIPNGCFISDVEGISINVQIALKPTKKFVKYTKEETTEKGWDIPSFLIEK